MYNQVEESVDLDFHAPMHFHSHKSRCSSTYYTFRKITLTVTNHLHLTDLGNSDSVCFLGRGVEFMKVIEVDTEAYYCSLGVILNTGLHVQPR